MSFTPASFNFPNFLKQITRKYFLKNVLKFTNLASLVRQMDGFSCYSIFFMKRGIFCTSHNQETLKKQNEGLDEALLRTTTDDFPHRKGIEEGQDQELGYDSTSSLKCFQILDHPRTLCIGCGLASYVRIPANPHQSKVSG